MSRLRPRRRASGCAQYAPLIKSREIVLVDTGVLYAVSVSSEDTVPEAIHAATGIQPGDQILLTADGGKVDASSLLQSAKGADRPLVLFNRRTLGSSAVPPPCVYDLDEIPVPDSSSVTYSATAMANPAMAVLQTYERTFCLHVDQARAYLEG